MQISNTDPCLSVPKQVVLYGDSLNTTAGWSDWSWGSIRNYAYTADKRWYVGVVRSAHVWKCVCVWKCVKVVWDVVCGMWRERFYDILNYHCWMERLELDIQ
jgi:hypothetical protein